MKYIYDQYRDFLEQKDISELEFNELLKQGYTISRLSIHPAVDTDIWDVEVKLVSIWDDQLHVIHRPKGFDPEEAEDNPFLDEDMGDEDEEENDWT